MKQTQVYDFEYPEPADFGNGGLDLQIVAEQAEAQILAIQSGYAQVNKKPTIVLQTTSVQSLAANAGLTPFSVLNILVGASTTTYQYGFDFGILDLHAIPAGSYMFGGSGQFLTTGSLVNNSYRQMAISAATPNGPQFTNYKVSTFTTSATENSLATGTCMSVLGTFDYTPAANPVAQPPQLWWGFQHGNTGATVGLQIGAQFFCTKISEIGS